MTFRPRNAYYLRISMDIVLPLLLYIDERHIDWMSDVVLQHVLADLRPLIIPKLQAEKDVHFGPGTAPGNKRGTVEVHRGETYQFAYFFRKTEPHTVLFKVDLYFFAELYPPAPKPPSRSADQKKRSRSRESAKQSKRKRAKSKRKGKRPEGHLDEDEWFGEESEDIDDADPIEPRPVRKQHRTMADTYQQDGDDGNVEGMHEDVAMNLLPETDGESSENFNATLVSDRDAAACDANDQTSEMELVIEEEEIKPKPILKLKYQSFPISGHCLCVVVEPWPPLRAETRPSEGPDTQLRHGRLEPSRVPSIGSVIAGKRVKTPLFLPEYDSAPSETPFGTEKTLPLVPLVEDTPSIPQDDGDDDLMNFSQTLNATGHMHAIAADDDDDMDGAVLFGDADEVRELL